MRRLLFLLLAVCMMGLPQQAISNRLTPAWTQHRYHPVQRALWDCDARFIGVAAGRGSGKTELAKRNLVRHLAKKTQWRDPWYFYAAPTRQQAKFIAWEDLIALIPRRWIKGEINRTDLIIHTKNGSHLQIVGLDKPQRFEGFHRWVGGVLDESSEYKPGVFNVSVLPALSWREAWCWRIGAPKPQGSSVLEFRKWFRQAATGELDNAAAFTWPSDEILLPEKLLAARQMLDARDYRSQFGGVFLDAVGGIHHAFSRAHNVRPCVYRRESPIVVGSDFNVDPMAWALAHVVDGKRLEWFDEIWLRDANTLRTLDVLYDRYGDHQGGFEFYGDATGRARKTSAAESDYRQIEDDKRFQKLGRSVFYPRANPAVADRFAACNAMLCNAAGVRRMHVDPRCTHLIEDLEARHYKQGTREVADSGDLGHITDAMGYAVHWLFPVQLDLGDDIPEVYFSSGV